MPCAVPRCNTSGQFSLVQFPRSHFLYERWRSAIEQGSGCLLPKNHNPLKAEICQQHFESAGAEGDYREPVMFLNYRTGQTVHLSCCRLCLQFYPDDRIITDTASVPKLGMAPLDEVLKVGFGVQLSCSEGLGGVCEECLVRLDMYIGMRKRFSLAAKSCKNMKLLIQGEGRLQFREIREAKPVVVATSWEIVDKILDSPAIIEEDSIYKVETKSTTVSNEFDLIDIVEEEQVQETEDDCKKVSHKEEYINDNRPEDLKHKERQSPAEQKRKRGRPRGSGRPVIRKKCKLKGFTERKCYMCVQLFETTEQLFSHMVQHIDHKLTCEACDESFPNLTKYNRHLSKHDPVERPMKCDHCEIRFTDGLGKRRHEKLKHDIDHQVSTFNYADRRKGGKFTCQHCGKQCVSLSFLEEHEDAHVGIKRHECKSCGRLFANKNNLERHYLIHTSEKPYKCEICGKAFRQSPMYKDHLRLHSGETPYACSGCDLQFTSTTLLRKHKIRFHVASSAQSSGNVVAPRSQNYCRFCAIAFRRHSLLVDHIVQVHATEQVEFFQCQMCEQRFVDKQAFEMHERNHEKNFQCGYCDRAFSSLQALQAHEPMHDGVRGFTCRTCSKTFSHMANLKRHELLHQGIKKHECDFCGKRFAQSNQLHTHRRTHTGEKPYECQKCGKRFADNSTLCKHRKNVCRIVELPALVEEGT